ncbi:putative leucine-rich repeat receptor-like serine/threonine-protein kinase At2g14440 [Pyrus communis]|uniref:putative leucine-rich repeat receptor-like serine/threonine-protein kinase At2g14440 n=1 Tax=Pyrus communis TaxID=23211 RepID=UPI0035BED4BC
MSLSLLPLLLLLSLLPLSLSLSLPRGTLINCGAAVKSEIDGREWLPDTGFVSGGTSRNLTTPGLVPILSTARSFPNYPHRKFCYTVHVYRNAKYMVRTTYYYYGSDSPPVFDQIVDGTFWAVVNTTEDYANGMSSYYEGVFLAQGKTMSVCLGSNNYTESDPFISALEFVILEDSLYNSTDFKSHGLSLVARNGFGYTGPIIRYPDDQFDRFWVPFEELNPLIPINVSNSNASVSGMWNMPPSKVFESELTTGQAEAMELDWPPGSVPESNYYIALYFASGDSLGSRVINISINGVQYYKDLDVKPGGLVVYATQWPLSGSTRITMTPSGRSIGGALINAGEMFDVLPLGGTTLTRDVIALQGVKQSLQNPPPGWSGDPCLPRQYSWTGITCSSGPRVRVVSLNLTSMGLSGSLSPRIANMTALSNILLGKNKFTGPIPDLSSLKLLEKLHLEDNHFSGNIPSSLGSIDSLHELFLQNNCLTGEVPDSLVGKSGLDLRTSGNSFSAPPPT